MNDETDLLTPPKKLALAYAAAAERACLELLLEFDARLAQIVSRDGEVVMAQMRMAWWRDVIAKDADSRPSGEPMVAKLNEIEAAADEDAAAGDVTGAMSHIIDGWDGLLAHEEWNDAVLIDHAKARAVGIFGAAELKAGKLWALHDLANMVSVDVAGALKTAHDGNPVKVKARHLSILAMSAKQQYDGGGAMSALRLFAHGLTGL